LDTLAHAININTPTAARRNSNACRRLPVTIDASAAASRENPTRAE
jgi:hypothetical protein